MDTTEIECLNQFFEKMGLVKGREIKRGADVAQLRKSALYQQEITKLRDALFKGRIVDLADKIADTLYVNAGCVVEFGLLPDGLGSEGLGYDRQDVAAGDLLINMSLGTLQRALRRGNAPEILKGVEMVNIVIRGIAATHNLPVAELFLETHRSNMTKLWSDGKSRIDEDTGKVIKPATFSPPNIEKVLGL